MQRHFVASWRRDALAAFQVEAGHEQRWPTMSAATKYAPPTASGAVGRTPVPRQQRGEGRGLEEAGGPAEQPVSSQLSALFPICF